MDEERHGPLSGNIFPALILKEAVNVLRDNKGEFSIPEYAERLKFHASKIDINNLQPDRVYKVLQDTYSLSQTSEGFNPAGPYYNIPNFDRPVENILKDALSTIIATNLSSIEAIFKDPSSLPLAKRNEIQRACFSVLVSHYRRTDRPKVAKLLKENKETIINLLKQPKPGESVGEGTFSRWWMIFANRWMGNTDWIEGREDALNEREIIKDIVLQTLEADGKDKALNDRYHIIVGVSANQAATSAVLESLWEFTGINIADNDSLKKKLIDTWAYSLEINGMNIGRMVGEQSQYYAGALRVADDNFKVAMEIEEKRPGIMGRLFNNFGIAFFGRYPPELLLTQDEEQNDRSKQYGLVINAYADHNNAFYDENWLKNLPGQLQGKYATRIFEVGTLIDLIHVLNSCKRKYEPKISFGILSGHGTVKSIMLGGRTDSSYRFKVINLDELDPDMLKKIGELFKKGSFIILCSCSTGVEKGIAQRISLTGLTTLAPDDDSGVEGIIISLDPDGEIEDMKVKYAEANAKKYINGELFE